MSELCTAYKIIKPAATAANRAASPAAMYFGISYDLTAAILIGSCIKVTPKNYVKLFCGESCSYGSFRIVKIGT